MKMLLTMSAYGAVIILIIFFLRLFCIKKLPKKTFKMLWLLAAARMLLPIFISVQIDLPLMPVNNYEYISEYYLFDNSTECYQNISKSDHTAYEVKPKEIDFDFFMWIWSVGMLILTSFFVGSYIRGIRKYKNAEISEESKLLEVINNADLRRKVTVLESEKTDTFLTYGIVNPKIICPHNFSSCDKDKVKYAVMHELVHIKNFDVLYKIVIVATVCVHWFNPFVWVMITFANRDLELSCDEELLKIFMIDKKEYALALIDFKEKRRGISVFNSFGKNAIEERIEMIMKFKKSAVISTAAAVGIVLCTASAFAFSAKLKTSEVSDDISVSSIVEPESNNNNSETGIQTIYDEYGNSFSIEKNEILNVVYDEYGNIVFTDKISHENNTSEYTEQASDVEYNSSETKFFYTTDGTKISLPPKATYGVIRHIPEDEWISGTLAAEELKKYVNDSDNFTYPIDVEYNDYYEYNGAFSILAPKGENIYAMSDGIVISADFSFPFGKSLVIQHEDGSVWLYAHCDDLCVGADDNVKAGDIIAHVGSTGATSDNMLYIYNY